MCDEMSPQAKQAIPRLKTAESCVQSYATAKTRVHTLSDIHHDLHNPDGSALWWRTGSVQPNQLLDIKPPNYGSACAQLSFKGLLYLYSVPCTVQQSAEE